MRMRKESVFHILNLLIIIIITAHSANKKQTHIFSQHEGGASQFINIKVCKRKICKSRRIEKGWNYYVVNAKRWICKERRAELGSWKNIFFTCCVLISLHSVFHNYNYKLNKNDCNAMQKGW